MVREVWVNIGSGNGLVPLGTHQYWLVINVARLAFIWGQLNRSCLSYHLLTNENYKFGNTATSPRELMLNKEIRVSSKYRWYPAKGPYPPCLRMADRALLAGYPRYGIPWLNIAATTSVATCSYRVNGMARTLFHTRPLTSNPKISARHATTDVNKTRETKTIHTIWLRGRNNCCVVESVKSAPIAWLSEKKG